MIYILWMIHIFHKFGGGYLAALWAIKLFVWFPEIVIECSFPIQRAWHSSDDLQLRWHECNFFLTFGKNKDICTMVLTLGVLVSLIFKLFWTEGVVRAYILLLDLFPANYITNKGELYLESQCPFNLVEFLSLLAVQSVFFLSNS